MRHIYGADFSGAMNPKIFYVHGILEDSILTLKSYITCDDRLDLYHGIVRSKDAIWGLDFPFGIPSIALPRLGFSSYEEMLSGINQMTRKGFARFIDESMQDYPRKCADKHSAYCRATDIAVNAHSVFKTVNPNLRVMLYAGLKLIRYLRDAGINVYPFGNAQGGYDPEYTTVYEIYPSYAWQKAELKRSMDIDKFIEKFNRLGYLTVINEIDKSAVDNQDLADSVVACVMMAAAYVTQNIDKSWDYRLPIVTDEEWQHRHTEGLIVRF